jgi:uncharacterized protein (DUF433 family)
LKARVLAECMQLGASVAEVAMSHGLNANLVHKWRRAVQAVQVSTTRQTAIALPPVLSEGYFQSEAAMDWKQHITTDPSILRRVSRCTGTRVPVTVVLDNLADVATPAKILRQYPGLRAEHLQAVHCYASELARERIVFLPA